MIGELVADVKAVRENIAKIERFMKDYDERINSLENWRAQVGGVILGISTVISTIITIISVFVQRIIIKDF
jgi:hypothetical protein